MPSNTTQPTASKCTVFTTPDRPAPDRPATDRPPSAPSTVGERPPTAPEAAAATTATSAASTVGLSTTGSSTRDRPLVTLSMNIMSFYKKINEQYFIDMRLKAPGPKYNAGYDDQNGHYIVYTGEEIAERYTVQETLGKGSFGTVLKCWDEKREEHVAVKIIRNGHNFRQQAKLEVDILLRLNQMKSPVTTGLIVCLLKVLEWKGHLVLVFELLSFNLYQLLKCTRFNGVSLDLVRKFAWQLLQVLSALEKCNYPVIHCDLKPENILLKNQNRSGIKVIDFGSSCYESKRMFKYIQSRFYRAPEVILGLPYNRSIDRWSLGCILAELHTGVPLFGGRTEEQQLQRMEAMLGPVPQYMIEQSPKKDKFYTKRDDGRWVLKEKYPNEKTLESVIGVRTNGPSGRRAGQPGHDEATYELFHDFLKEFLHYDAAERSSVDTCIAHRFITMAMETSSPPQSPTGDAAKDMAKMATPPQESPAKASPATS